MSNFAPRYKSIMPSGTTPRALRARTTKAVAEIRSRIEKLAAPYADVDNSVVGAVSDLSRAFDEFERRIHETQQYLEECEL